MDWNALHARLAEDHKEAPQRAELARRALESCREAVAQLASLGHNFHLVDGPPPERQEYPKWVYHATQEARVIHHPTDLVALGEGWHDHPDKARQAAGEATQFAGRGGVSRTGLPAPTGLVSGKSTDEVGQNASQGG